MADITFSDAISGAGNSVSPAVARTFSGTPGTDLDAICIAGVAVAAGPISGVPANWTEIFNELFHTSGTSYYLYAYWHKHLGGSEPATHTWTAPTGRWAITNASYKNVHLTSPIHLSSKQTNASSANVTAPGLDPTQTNNMAIFVGAGASTGTWTAPTGYSGSGTDADLSKPAAALITTGQAFKLLADGTATGDVIGTLSGAAVNCGGLILLQNAVPVSDSAGDTGTVTVGTATASGLTVSATAGVNRIP